MKEELREELVRLAEGGLFLTPAVYAQYGSFSLAEVLDGRTWDEALDEAGVEGGGGMVSRERIMDDIARVADELGRPPSYDEYCELGKYAITTVRDRCGRWDSVRAEMGWKP